MKKLLSILGAVGLIATSSASVVACGPTKTDNGKNTNPSEDQDDQLFDVTIMAFDSTGTVFYTAIEHNIESGETLESVMLLDDIKDDFTWVDQWYEQYNSLFLTGIGGIAADSSSNYWSIYSPTFDQAKDQDNFYSNAGVGGMIVNCDEIAIFALQDLC